MKKDIVSNRIWFIILCVLIAANALVWTGAHANYHQAGHADSLTDSYEDKIVDMDDANKRTLVTHLYTMDAFLDKTEVIFENNSFPAGVTAMIAFDGDNMGKKGDEYGREAVDRLMIGFADTVKKHFPDSELNIVSNVGEKSDEFYMLLMGRNSKEELIQEIEDFQEDIRLIRIKTDDGREFGGSVSIGIAVMDEGQTFESLFEEADQAAYEAKEAGKDCYRVSD